MSPDSGQAIALPLDGERFVPDEMHGNIELEHRHRYLFASQFVSGKAVLDIASGEGYGSALLAKSARRVIGVDISERAVEHAKQRYDAQNLEFTTGSCAAIPLDDGAVDVVVSFETIEHHTEHEAMMCEVKRVLRPGGFLVISSPDKLEYSDKPSYQNPFHVKELYREEFQTLLSTHFRNVRLFGQRVVFGSMLLGDPQSQGIRFQRNEREPAPAPGDLEPVYWVAMASDDPLPAATDSVYEQPAAAFWGAVDQQRNSTLAKLIRVIAASSSEQLRSCLRSEWYLQQNHDLVETGVDPYEHWIEVGAQEGRLPSGNPLSLVEALLREREERLEQTLKRSQDSLERAQKELLEQRTSLQTELARIQRETGGKIESQLREMAEREKTVAAQLLLQQETFESQRAHFADAADRKLAALASQSGEREGSLRQEMQALQERLEQTHRQSQHILEQTQREAEERVQHLQTSLQEQRISLQEEIAQARHETRVEVERHLQLSAEREQAFAEQLLAQKEKLHSERAALSEALEQRRASQAQEHIEREHQLRQDIQCLQERLQQTQSQSRETLERVHRESQERLEQAQKKSLEQLAQQQADFDAERTRLAGAADQKLAALAAQYADRERQLQEDLQYLQERLDRTQRETRERVESQLQQSVEREQAFAGQLLQQHGHFNAQLATLAAEFGERDLRLRQDLLTLQERSEVMMIEDRSLLRTQYSSVLTDLKRDLEILQTSLSWRLAAPIRAVAAAFGSKARLPQLPEVDSLMRLPTSRDHKITLHEQTALLCESHSAGNE